MFVKREGILAIYPKYFTKSISTFKACNRIHFPQIAFYNIYNKHILVLQYIMYCARIVFFENKYIFDKDENFKLLESLFALNI